MTNLSELLQSAVQLHRGGQFDRAQQMYEEILQTDPLHADALNLRALLAWQTGHFSESLAYARQAVALDPLQSAYHANLGEAYRGLGQMAEAIACYREAVRLQPAASPAQLNLGKLLQQFGSPTEAITCFQRTLQLDPRSYEAYYQLGSIVHQQGQLHAAGEHYEKVLQLNPQHLGAMLNLAGIRRVEGNLAAATILYEQILRVAPQFPEAHFNLGNLYQLQGKRKEAVACYHQSLQLKPGAGDAMCNLGNVLRELGQLDDALTYLQKAVEQQPDASAPINNLGTVLQDLGRLEEARHYIERAIELEPDKAEFHYNLGTVLLDRNRSIACYDQALRLKPDYSQALCSRGMAWISLGNFQPGWAGYEHRIDCEQFDTNRFSKPQWDGSPLEDRTLLIHCEQGLGDTLQFIRYVPLAQARGKKVIVAAQPALVPLLAQSGFTGLIPKESTPPPFDVHAPLMSLPFIFHTELDAIPREVPYVHAAPAKVEQWRGELEQYAGLKIGISWQGRTNYRFDRLRSIALEHFAPLARPGVRLLSLQKGPGTEQLAGLHRRFEVVDLSPALDHGGAFLDTAAVMKNLDLVVTSDTAIAHLAGALGVRVWLALSAAPDWRWMVERDDSPWYPTMRLFRQTKLGRWSDVFERMAEALGTIKTTS